MTNRTILLISTLDWAGPVAARLALALCEAGFSVAALAPPNDVVCAARPISKIFVLHAFAQKRALRIALRRSKPYLVVPCDDPAVSLLHQIYSEGSDQRSQSAIRGLIKRSLGNPDSFGITLSKSAQIRHARSIGIRVPETRIVPEDDALGNSATGFVPPYMVKVDGGWGGSGVTLVRGPREGLRAIARARSPDWARVIKRVIDGWTVTPLVARLRKQAPAITVQQYVSGRPAHRAVVCWEGEILAGISCEAICAPGNGPATVVRLTQHPEMEDTTARLVRSLGISGFCCCDFMIESESKCAYLLELNPRATQTCHLVKIGTKGLAPALFERATGLEARGASRSVPNETVALFPREWGRDPASPYLRNAYHDIPWNHPDLVLACMRRKRRVRWTDRVRDLIRAG